MTEKDVFVPDILPHAPFDEMAVSLFRFLGKAEALGVSVTSVHIEACQPTVAHIVYTGDKELPWQ